MYYFDLDSCFYKYLAEIGIIKVEDFDYKEKTNDIDIFKIEDHIKVMSDFHKRILGYRGYMNKKLPNNIGKTVEQYKIYIKWLKRDLDKIKKGYDNSEFKQIIGEIGEKYLERAENCIDKIYENNYMDIIKRSSYRYEVCLKNVYFNNLRRRKNIEVINLEGCCYNMLEIDAINFLRKLNKKITNLDIRSIAFKFCSAEKLNEKSFSFIISMMDYPHEFMKCCNRYRANADLSNEKKCIHEIKKIVGRSN